MKKCIILLLLLLLFVLKLVGFMQIYCFHSFIRYIRYKNRFNNKKNYIAIYLKITIYLYITAKLLLISFIFPLICVLHLNICKIIMKPELLISWSFEFYYNVDFVDRIRFSNTMVQYNYRNNYIKKNSLNIEFWFSISKNEFAII